MSYKVKKIGFNILKKMALSEGYDLYVQHKRDYGIDKVNINIGSGGWECKGWINLDIPSDHYQEIHKGKKFVKYDIREDDIPFENESVDRIYCSHVIEHIELNFVHNMLRESYRVLKPGGVFRIACPDAEYMYRMSKIGKEYWTWLKPTFEGYKWPWEEVRAVDCLVQEIATARLQRVGRLRYEEDYEKKFDSMNMNDFLQYISKDIPWNVNYIGDHINYWTEDKLFKELRSCGYSKIVRSIYCGSYSDVMRNPAYFDLTRPQMSLYMEAFK